MARATGPLGGSFWGGGGVALSRRCLCVAGLISAARLVSGANLQAGRDAGGGGGGGGGGSGGGVGVLPEGARNGER